MDPIKVLEGKWTMLVGDEQLGPDANVIFTWRDGHLFRDDEDAGPIVVGNGLILATLADDVYLQLRIPFEPGTVNRLDGSMNTELEERAEGSARAGNATAPTIELVTLFF